MQNREFVTIIYIPARKPKDLEIFCVLYNNLVSLYFSLDTVFIQTCHPVHSAFFRRFFFDWNTHFVVFSGGVEQGLGGPTARSSLTICQNGGWEARRLDPAGIIIPPPAAPGTRADEGGGPSQGFLYGCFFTLSGGGP